MLILQNKYVIYKLLLIKQLDMGYVHKCTQSQPKTAAMKCVNYDNLIICNYANKIEDF